MPKRNKSGQFTTTKRRRRRRATASSPPRRRAKPGFNILNAAETYLLMNALTQGMFRTNPIEFIFTPKGLAKIGKDSSWVVSLPEIAKFGIGESSAYSGAKGGTLAEIIQANLGLGTQPGRRKGELAMVAAQVIGIPIAFKVGKKFARPLLTRTRKMLKDAGLKGVVTV